MLRPLARRPSRLRGLALVAGIGLAALSGAAGSASASALRSAGLGLSVPPAAAGAPALAAWFDGRTVLVAGADGAGIRSVGRLGGGLRRIAGSITLELSRDGQRLAVAAGGGAWLVDLVSGRPAVELPVAGGFDTALRWSPDGRSLLVFADGLRRCDLEPVLACRLIDRQAMPSTGASWSPDGSRFAYVRAWPGRRSVTTELVATAGADRWMLEQWRQTRRWALLPMSPVWTRRGLYWSALTASRGDRSGATLRVRTRVLQADGGVRTVHAAKADHELPFVAASDSPGGELLGVGLRWPSRTRETFSLRTLAADGTLGDYGVRVRGLRALVAPTVEPDLVDVVGVLADGRVALVRKAGVDGVGVLYLATPGQGLGAPVARGRGLTAAVAFPNAARKF